MPVPATEPKIDKEALLARYVAERDKRLRTDGSAQYHRTEGMFERYKLDVQAERIEREPLFDHVTFAFVGGGFAGLVTGARLAEVGVTDVRIVEKGSDFGGTWYWNRYPGAQCDTASMVYMPLLEETGHRPTEKYAHGPEILAQCGRIGRQYRLYEKALFQTEVTGAEWDETASRWIVSTNRGDRFTATYLGMGVGPLHVPKLPGIPGIETFAGHSFHTSRWDYAYTGGDAEGAPLDRLADKRVAIIGTGATAVQIVPHLAAAAGKLFVVQRTPSSVDVRDNRPIDPDWFATVATPGWQLRWLENFTDNQAGGNARDDLVQDGWTDISRRIRSRLMGLPREQMTQAAMLAAYEDCDFEKMEEIRARVDTTVADAATAQALKAWYRQLCKRPCFHDAYLPAFNQPSTELVDTDGKGVERITPAGFVVSGREYAVDCIIFASGFEVGSDYEKRAGFDPIGREGLTLSRAWRDGMRSLHGIHVHGFPNAFFVQPGQGANLISNIPHNLVEAGRTIATVVGHALTLGKPVVEVGENAQRAWVEQLLGGPPRLLGAPDCTPGYYNNEGQEPTAAMRSAVGYPAGPSAYFRYLDGWRTSGAFAGLTFT
ncbi:MAG: Cyclohexanone monooxygenase [Sphingomonas bacterium]|uniref:flavin-containing monooxygenase n=1 Tax=Sphingomonas bacterium TaxID=1895847 RepID=UPI00262A6C98|nr:NAD(P)/FAD-dependent oxidoreductase [Sphingomonas bacterium]MDB5696970.1 Cyclohexanone monooxygenase [Sphingomonas bacterium]